MAPVVAKGRVVAGSEKEDLPVAMEEAVVVVRVDAVVTTVMVE